MRGGSVPREGMKKGFMWMNRVLSTSPKGPLTSTAIIRLIDMHVACASLCFIFPFGPTHNDKSSWSSAPQGCRTFRGRSVGVFFQCSDESISLTGFRRSPTMAHIERQSAGTLFAILLFSEQAQKRRRKTMEWTHCPTPPF
jgi:hypothetical protein